ELPRIDGNREYLAVLCDAYRGYVKELRKNDPQNQGNVYLKRLLILDPGAVLDQPGSPQARLAAPAQPTSDLVARGKSPEPFSDDTISHAGAARALVEKADGETAPRRYDAAGKLYEQANRLDQAAATGRRDQWAYCKLHAVGQQLNQPASGGAAYPEMEREVR